MNEKIFKDENKNTQKQLMLALLDSAESFSIDKQLLDQAIMYYFYCPDNKIQTDDEFLKKVIEHYNELPPKFYVFLPKPRHYEREETQLFTNFYKRCDDDEWVNFYKKFYYSILPVQRHLFLIKMIKVAEKNNIVLKDISEKDLGIVDIQSRHLIMECAIKYNTADEFIAKVIDNNKDWAVGDSTYVSEWIKLANKYKRTNVVKLIQLKFASYI